MRRLFGVKKPITLTFLDVYAIISCAISLQGVTMIRKIVLLVFVVSLVFGIASIQAQESEETRRLSMDDQGQILIDGQIERTLVFTSYNLTENDIIRLVYEFENGSYMEIITHTNFYGSRGYQNRGLLEDDKNRILATISAFLQIPIQEEG